jgi:hypothetical protein
MDYQLLNDHLETRDLQQVADGLNTELVPTVRAAVAFLYRLVESSDAPLDAEAVIEQGIQEGQSGQLETLRQRLAAGDDTLTLGEIRTLAEAGDLDAEQRRELESEILRPPIGNIDVEKETEEAPDDETLEEWLDRKVEEREEE